MIEKKKMEEKLIKILEKSDLIIRCLQMLKDSPISRFDYYLAGGVIYQTVFNYYHGYDLNYGIKDYDIIYFDDNNLSYEAVDQVIKETKEIFNENGIRINLDIKNEARAHIWLKEKYNEELEQYKNLDEVLRSWGFSACAIGVRLEENNIKVIAPYGLEDLFDMKIRKVGNYDILEKARELKNKWPNIDISLVEKN